MGRSVLQACLLAFAALSMPLAEGLAEVVPTNGAPATAPAQQQDVSHLNTQLVAGLRRQVSGLQNLLAQVKEQIAERKAQSPIAGMGGKRNEPEQAANSQQPNTELHSALQSLIAQLREQKDLETQTPPVLDEAEQKDWQAARDAFGRTLADLQQQDDELRQLMTEPGKAQASLPSGPKPAQPAPPDVAQPAAQTLSEQQASEMRKQIADLQHQNEAVWSQLAGTKQELAQRTVELAQRTLDLEAARAEVQGLRKTVETAGAPRRDQEPPQQQTQKSRQQAQTARSAAPNPVVPAPQRFQPAQSARAQQPTEPTSTQLSVGQQLQFARQWLSAGRFDSARRVLATLQAQMILQPEDRQAGSDHDASASDVSDAIRWLDKGVPDQALRAINHALGPSVEARDGVRAWSGIPASGPR